MSYLKAVGLMLIAMIGFVIADANIKLASQTLSTGQVLLPLGLLSVLIYTPLAMRRGIRPVARDFFHPIVLLRNLTEMLGIFSMVKALASTDFALVTSITQGAPIIATFGAVLFLGEKVGWRRWLALFFGFVGVVIIIRPAGSSFEITLLWSLAAVTAMGLRDLLTRALPAELPTLRMANYGVLSVTATGALHLMLIGGAQPMTWPAAGFLLVSGITATVAYLALTSALRAYDVSAIAPFRYTRIVFGLAFGVLVFGEKLDIWMLVGVAITVGAGLFIFLRENKAPA